MWSFCFFRWPETVEAHQWSLWSHETVEPRSHWKFMWISNGHRAPFDLSITGWWFGCHQFGIFPEILGIIIIPIEKIHILQRGSNQQPVKYSLNPGDLMEVRHPKLGPHSYPVERPLCSSLLASFCMAFWFQNIQQICFSEGTTRSFERFFYYIYIPIFSIKVGSDKWYYPGLPENGCTKSDGMDDHICSIHIFLLWCMQHFQSHPSIMI